MFNFLTGCSYTCAAFNESVNKTFLHFLVPTSIWTQHKLLDITGAHATFLLSRKCRLANLGGSVGSRVTHLGCIRVFSHLDPFRQFLWTPYGSLIFLCAVWIVHRNSDPSKAPEANQTETISRGGLSSVPFFGGQCEHKAPQVRLSLFLHHKLSNQILLVTCAEIQQV